MAIRHGPGSIRVLYGYEIVDGEPWVQRKHVAWRSEVFHYGWDQDDWHYRTRGFFLPLENGLLVSTQWGTGNYCGNREAWTGTVEFLERCVDAEMACWWPHMDVGDERSMLVWPDGDKVCGWVSSDLWWGVIDHLGRLPTGTMTIPAVRVRSQDSLPIRGGSISSSSE